MLILSRTLVLLLTLVAVPQASRGILDRCQVNRDSAAHSKLPDGLVEVSGLAAGPGGTLLTHGDEYGTVTVLDGKSLQVVRAVNLQGNPRDDFEGIATAGDSVALMTSAGRLYFFQLGTAPAARYSMVGTGLGRYCDLEGLAWHRVSGTLLMPCKQPRGAAKGVQGLTVFRYRLGPTPGTIPPIVVRAAELSRVAGVPELRATSVEVDQATGHLLVLSSNPAMVVEIDSAGSAIGATFLPLKRHPQPEGLTLTPDAMWIADEGAGRKGTLMRYPCK
jgi:uncharacterized protein YjiK